MSEVENTTSSELEELKERADALGITYSGNIGVDTLRKRVNDAITGEGAGDASINTDENTTANTPVDKVVELTPAQKRLAAKREGLALKRVFITCMNPNKKEWEGEIITAGNSVMGTVRRMVPFNVETHVETIIYKVLKGRECQTFVTVKDDKGNKIRKGKLIKEFAIDDLPPLTEEEIKDLAQRQAMAKGTQAA